MLRLQTSPDKRRISVVPPRSAFEPTVLTVFGDDQVTSASFDEKFGPETNDTSKHPTRDTVDATKSALSSLPNPGAAKTQLGLNMFRSKIADSNNIAASTPKKNNRLVGLIGRFSKVFFTPPRTPTTVIASPSIPHSSKDLPKAGSSGNEDQVNVNYNVANILAERLDELNGSQVPQTPWNLTTPPTDENTFKFSQAKASSTPNKEGKTSGLIKSDMWHEEVFPKCKKNLASFLDVLDVTKKDENTKSAGMMETAVIKTEVKKSMNPENENADAPTALEFLATNQADDTIGSGPGTQNPKTAKTHFGLSMFDPKSSDSNTAPAPTPKKSSLFVGLIGRIAKIFKTSPPGVTMRNGAVGLSSVREFQVSECHKALEVLVNGMQAGTSDSITTIYRNIDESERKMTLAMKSTPTLSTDTSEAENEKFGDSVGTINRPNIMEEQKTPTTASESTPPEENIGDETDGVSPAQHSEVPESRQVLVAMAKIEQAGTFGTTPKPTMSQLKTAHRSKPKTEAKRQIGLSVSILPAALTAALIAYENEKRAEDEKAHSSGKLKSCFSNSNMLDKVPDYFLESITPCTTPTELMFQKNVRTPFPEISKELRRKKFRNKIELVFSQRAKKTVRFQEEVELIPREPTVQEGADEDGVEVAPDTDPNNNTI